MKHHTPHVAAKYTLFHARVKGGFFIFCGILCGQIKSRVFVKKHGVAMVGPWGFEPQTFCTPSKRATSLRYGPKKIDAWEREKNIRNGEEMSSGHFEKFLLYARTGIW